MLTMQLGDADEFFGIFQWQKREAKRKREEKRKIHIYSRWQKNIWPFFFFSFLFSLFLLFFCLLLDLSTNLVDGLSTIHLKSTKKSYWLRFSLCWCLFTRLNWSVYLLSLNFHRLAILSRLSNHDSTKIFYLRDDLLHHSKYEDVRMNERAEVNYSFEHFLLLRLLSFSMRRIML